MKPKITVYYVDWETTTRDDRFRASEGEFVGIDKYKRMGSWDWDKPDWRLNLLDSVFEEFNIGETPRQQEIRSMCVGDIIVLGEGEGAEAHLCSRMGWTELDLTHSDIRDMG